VTKVNSNELILKHGILRNQYQDQFFEYIMEEKNNIEIIEDLVNKGISLQRESKHKDAIVCFDKAISLDEKMNGQADSNLLLLKDNSLMKIDTND